MSSFTPPDPAAQDYSHLEDLACGYWYSEVFFTALNLNIFSKLAAGTADLSTFCADHGFDISGTKRLFPALKQLGLLEYENGYWFPTQISATYLDRAKADCLCDFFLYRQYMQDGWKSLTTQIDPEAKAETTPNSSYSERNLYYVKALDLLARQKAKEVYELVNMSCKWQGKVLDIGGGAGALCRHFIQQQPNSKGVVFDLKEVHQAAVVIYPDPADWHNIEYLEGDFITLSKAEMTATYGLVIMANFLHAYDRTTAKKLLKKSCSLLADDGILVIHDYFPDRQTDHNAKGILYDLHMLANTYNGTCHTSQDITVWLKENGLQQSITLDLTTDSSLMISSHSQTIANTENWIQTAKDQGFRTAVLLNSSEIVTEPWVALKCQFGCEKYGKGLQCPPFSMEVEKTRELLKSYTKCLLVESTPPGAQFHKKLLALERAAFLQGKHKALVFGAGPCTLCPDCDTTKPCAQPGKARPSMEACGIDVYETMKNAGLELSPRTEKNQYVKYIGMLLID